MEEWELPEDTRQAQQATRLVNLAYLLSGPPRTFAEIRAEMEKIGAYQGEPETARKAFTRDKQKLRGLGIDVAEADDTYRIEVRNVRPRHDLGAEELASLRFAAERLVPAVDPVVRQDLRSGLAKLGAGDLQGPSEWRAPATVSRVLLLVHDAHRSRRPLQIHYTNAQGESTTRVLHPWALRCSEGHWYVRGWDSLSTSERTFKIDRIDPERVAFTSGTFHAPSDLERTLTTLRAEPWEWGEAEPTSVRLRLPAAVAAHVLPAGATLVVDSDTTEAEMSVRDLDAFASWLLRHGDEIELLGPSAARVRVADRLEATVDALAREPAPLGEDALTAAFADRDVGPHQPGPNQVERADRLLRLIGLASRREYSNAELAQVLEITEEELADDLAQLTYYCGLPPLYGGDMVEAVPFAGRVQVRGPALPLVDQLTGREAAALEIALRTAMSDATLETESRSVLESALAAIRADKPEPPGIEIEPPTTPPESATINSALAKAIRELRTVAISHSNPGTGAPRTRVVDPWQLNEAKGHTYLLAWDHDKRETRVFRSDRIQAVNPTNEHFEPPDTTGVMFDAGYMPSPADEFVYLRIPHDHVAWARARYGSDAVAEVEDDCVLRLPTSDVARLAPLLLSLLPASEVLAPPDARRAVSELATRILGRLRDAPPWPKLADR